MAKNGGQSLREVDLGIVRTHVPDVSCERKQQLAKGRLRSTTIPAAATISCHFTFDTVRKRHEEERADRIQERDHAGVDQIFVTVTPCGV